MKSGVTARAPIEEVLTMPAADVVHELSAIVGRPSVIELAGVVDRGAVARWLGGSEQHPRREQALRLALQVVRTLLERHPQKAVRSWLAGLNPRLEHRSAIMVIRSIAIGEVRGEAAEEAARAVLAAAAHA